MIVKDFLNALKTALKTSDKNAHLRLPERHGIHSSFFAVNVYDDDGVYIGLGDGMQCGLKVRNVIRKLSGVNEELPVYIATSSDSVEECIRVLPDPKYKYCVLLETQND